MVIVPGETLDKEATCAAGGWDRFSIDDETALLLGPGSALLTYRFDGRREDFEYTALLSSAYVRDESGEWKLAFHQQTPLG